MLKDYFTLALRNLWHRKLRSWLTIMGIFIGIAAVVSLISLSQGMQEGIKGELEKVGADRIIVTPGGGAASYMGPMAGGLSSTKLYDKDIEIVRKVKGVNFCSGVIIEEKQAEFMDEKKSINIMGSPTDPEGMEYINELSFFRIAKGRQLRAGDRYKAVVGFDLAADTFDSEIKIRDKITIAGKDFEVVGVQMKAGTGVHDIVLRIPLDVAQEMFEKPDQVSMIFAKVKEGFKPGEVAERAQKELRKAKGEKEGEEGFTVKSAEDMLRQFTVILDVVQTVLVGVAAISLIVGGVGIMTTMYTSITERKREIGVMKAIGATNNDIMSIFLVESGLIGVAGGILGVALGIGFAKAVEAVVALLGVAVLKASLSPYLIIGSLLFAFLVGALSGIWPAMQAAKLNPVETLRN